jgi:hypothetical protein
MQILPLAAKFDHHTGFAMYETTDEYLDLIVKNGCLILVEKAFPGGKLKREVISLATHDGRPLTLSTPQGFTASPFKISREIFDEWLAANFIEQNGREDADGRTFFRLTQAGRSRVDLVRNMSRMTVSTYTDFD